MLVTKNPYQSPFDFKKPEIMRGHVKRVAPDLPHLCSSNDTVCGLLKNLADEFLEGTYNCKLPPNLSGYLYHIDSERVYSAGLNQKVCNRGTLKFKEE
jgi:hypothetical protein